MDENSIVDKPHAIARFGKAVAQRYQLLLDNVTPYALARWLFTVVANVLFLFRVIFVQGYYIVAYALGIYHLNLLIGFLTPKIDPAFDLDSDNEDGPSLPTRSNDEFRPFMRRLPEFKFWHTATKGTLIAFGCTFFEVFDIPVFWPILVVYFFILFTLTMKRQIKHMIKYRYVPFSVGKPKHTGKGVPHTAPSTQLDDVKPLLPAAVAPPPAASLY